MKEAATKRKIQALKQQFLQQNRQENPHSSSRHRGQRSSPDAHPLRVSAPGMQELKAKADASNPWEVGRSQGEQLMASSNGEWRAVNMSDKNLEQKGSHKHRRGDTVQHHHPDSNAEHKRGGYHFQSVRECTNPDVDIMVDGDHMTVRNGHMTSPRESYTPGTISSNEHTHFTTADKDINTHTQSNSDHHNVPSNAYGHSTYHTSSPLSHVTTPTSDMIPPTSHSNQAPSQNTSPKSHMTTPRSHTDHFYKSHDHPTKSH